GAGLALVVAQNRHMRRRLVGGSELMIVIGGGILTGAFAGAAGQSLFYFLAGFETIGGAGRVVAWVVLGCGVGFGMSHFVPNLNRRRAVAAGTIGGAFAAVWAGLIAIGAGLALVVAQNRHMRRRLVGGSELMIVIGGGILTGAFAGAAGQSLFYFLAGFETIGGAGRVVAWVVLGCGVGFGMSHFVPNLNRRRAVAAGTIGGAFAAVFFLTVVPVVGDTIGRLLGACVLGLATGATLVLMEITYRKAWLVVDWGRNETSTLLLGRKPIIVGNAKDAHICPAFDENGPAVLATIGLQDDGSVMLDRSGDRRRLEDGERIEFGKVTLLVRTAVVKDPDATPPDVPAPPPPPPKPKKKAKASSGGPKWYDNA
ncbi:MAG: hypothetical protein ACYTDU_17155, partial [Planctomycetota bacterium]